MNKEKIKEADISNAIDHYLKDRYYVDSLFDKYDFLALPSAQLFPFDKNRFQKYPRNSNGHIIDGWKSQYLRVCSNYTISVPVGFNEGTSDGMQLVEKANQIQK